jgi:hypothetical protein
VISSSTFVNLDSTISWVVWIVATIMSLFISSLRFSILLLSEVYSLVWCVGSGVLLVGCCVLERNLPASVIEILLMTRCLLAKMGQTAVPAAWSGFALVGHLHWFLHRLFNSWALAQYLHFGMCEHRSSGCPKVQHLRHNDGLVMYFFTGNISWGIITSRVKFKVLKYSDKLEEYLCCCWCLCL